MKDRRIKRRHKAEPTAVLYLRVPVSIHQKLGDIAYEKGMSINMSARLILEKHFEELENESRALQNDSC